MSDTKTIGRLALDYPAERSRRGTYVPTTARHVQRTLWRFAEHVGLDKTPAKITRRHVERFLGLTPLAPSTARQYLSILREWCAWMVVNGHLRRDPTVGVASPKEPRRLPRGMPTADVVALVRVAPDKRSVVMVLLMVQEGLRCKEVAGLELGDVDERERLIFVRSGKGGHQRVVPLSDETRLAVRAYLAEHPATVGPLVRSYLDPRRGITAQYVSDLVRRLFWAAGVKQARLDGRSAHALRHSFATDVLRNGAHVRDVQALLGHANLATTERYLPWVVGDLRKATAGRSYQYRGAAGEA